MGWKTIETAPRDGSRILVADKTDFAAAEWTNDRWVLSPIVWVGGDHDGGLADVDFVPTHWTQPALPE